MLDTRPSSPTFSLLGIPVQVSLWHFVWMLLLFAQYFQTDPAFAIGLILIGSFSILMHEMGHAMVSRHLGLQPEILLVSLGGLTRHHPARRPRDEFLIVAAGPSMNFVLAAIFYFASPHAEGMLGSLLVGGMVINVIWGLYNLLPIMPLDGGQILRTILHKVFKPLKAERATYGTGLVVGVLVVAYFLFRGQMFAAMFVVLAVLQNWQMLRMLDSAPEKHETEKHPRVRELLDEARNAYQTGDLEHAIRAVYQARDQPWLSREEADQCWEILALASARQQRWEDALRYSERVPHSRTAAQVQAACLEALGEPQRIRRFLSTPTAMLLPPERISQLQDMARA